MQFMFDAKGDTIKTDDYWKLCVGSCHAATALRQDYRQMLTQCKMDIGFKYIRFHGLFCDDMCVVRKSITGNTVYSFVNIDSIFDFFLSIGIKPFVELSFTPDCLKTGEEKLFFYKANISPPKSEGWVELITTFVRHMIDRYGLSEVRTWYFEVWNEPNLGKESGIVGGRFWSGSIEQYFQLYKLTADTIKHIDNRLKVGGPATSNNALIPEMLQFCKDTDTPIDFVTTHHYPTDIALGYGVEDSQNFTNAFNSVDWSDKDKLQKLIGEYVTFQQDIWKKVDRGVLTQMARRAKSEAGELPLIYTEWSSLAGIESDGEFGASFIAKTVLDNANIVEGYSFWTFCDIVEEVGMPNCEFHGGFGLMTVNSIKKAPYNAFVLLSKLGEKRYIQQYGNGTVDIYFFENVASHCLQIFAVNHQSLLHKIDTQNICVQIKNAQLLTCADCYRVDQHHANALTAWKQMGANPYPTATQLLELKAAAEIKRERIDIDNNSVSIEMPPQSIVLINAYLK